VTRRTSFKPTSYIFLIIIVIALSPTRIAAWGSKGHQVIARIAMARLSSSARQAVAELLDSGETLETVSNWADDRKVQGADTLSWHSVSIPLSSSRYSKNDCGPGETCIIDAIAQQLAILKDTNNDSSKRSDALKYLVNLIGDLHQPFHISTNTNPPDVGASLVRVTALMSGRSTNLHEVWDSDLVEYGLKESSSRNVGDYANYLGKQLSQNSNNQGPISARGSVIDWALETHKLPWGAYYFSNGEFMVADPKRSWTLDRPYYDKNLPIVEDQLRRAGVRLAKVLNDAFNVKLAS
jgi:hypothetical protein